MTPSPTAIATNGAAAELKPAVIADADTLPEIRRKILLVGATGKQGRALIQALLHEKDIPSTSSTSLTSSARTSTRTSRRTSEVANRPPLHPPSDDSDSTTDEADQSGESSNDTTLTLIEDDNLGSNVNNKNKQRIAWDILALTRNPESPRAEALLKLLPDPETSPHTLTLVQGDVNSEASIRAVFERESGHAAYKDTDSSTTETKPKPKGEGKEGRIWGVFVVLEYPGPSTKSDHIEVKQGKVLTDLSYEFHVELFVYSSSLPAPSSANADEFDPTHLDKRANERYCRELGLDRGEPRGLNWVIVRPGIFMECFDGFMGWIAVTVFREGLTKDATLPLVASKDIGRVVAGVFRNPEEYIHKTLVVTSGAVTMRDVMAAHQRATGKPIPAMPALLGKLLLRMNAGSRKIIRQFQLQYNARSKGEYYPEFESEMALARPICHLHSYEEWKRSELELADSENTAPEAGWNQVSIWKLVTGRS